MVSGKTVVAIRLLTMGTTRNPIVIDTSNVIILMATLVFPHG